MAGPDSTNQTTARRTINLASNFVHAPAQGHCGDQRINSSSVSVGEMENPAPVYSCKTKAIGHGPQLSTFVWEIQNRRRPSVRHRVAQRSGGLPSLKRKEGRISNHLLAEQRLKGSLSVFSSAYKRQRDEFVKDAVPWSSADRLRINTLGTARVEATEEW